MSKSKKSMSSSDDWRSKIVTLAWAKHDEDWIVDYLMNGSNPQISDLLEQHAGEGHGVKFKFSEYYDCWVVSVTFGGDRHPYAGYTAVMYISEFLKIPGALAYLFDVLVPNEDARLRQMGLSIF